MESGPKLPQQNDAPRQNFVPPFRLTNPGGDEIYQRAQETLRRRFSLPLENFVQEPLRQEWDLSPELAADIVRHRIELPPMYLALLDSAWQVLRGVLAKDSNHPLISPYEIVLLPSHLWSQVKKHGDSLAALSIGRFIFMPWNKEKPHSSWSFLRVVLHEITHGLQALHIRHQPEKDFVVVGRGLRVGEEGIWIHEAATDWLAALILLRMSDQPEFSVLKVQWPGIAWEIEEANNAWRSIRKAFPSAAFLPVRPFSPSQYLNSPNKDLSLKPPRIHKAMMFTFLVGQQLDRAGPTASLPYSDIPPRLEQLAFSQGLPLLIPHLIVAAQKGDRSVLVDIAKRLPPEDRLKWQSATGVSVAAGESPGE